jgi:AraC-like DNA-binding protein
MTFILSREEYQDLLDEGTQTRSENTAESEVYFRYPEDLGYAYHWSMEVRSGIKLAIKDRYCYQPLIIKQPEREHPIELSFCLAGERGDSVFGDSISGRNVLFGNGICPSGELMFSPNQQLLILDLHIKPEVFQNLLPQASDSSLAVIKTLLRDRGEWLYAISKKTNPAMEIVLQQILNCPYQGYIKQLYLESKTLELISLQLEELLNSSDHASCALSLCDRDCIFQARQLLDQQLDQAPTLSVLAHQVGLNERKLKEGFQQLFQTTPFEYLRDRRLEQAQQLLMETNRSVQEIAYTVGYRSRSQFANAFRQKFGVNPKAYQCHWRDWG